MGQLPLSTPISTEQMSINIIILVKLYSVENRQERVEAPCPPQGLFEGIRLDLLRWQALRVHPPVAPAAGGGGGCP